MTKLATTPITTTNPTLGLRKSKLPGGAAPAQEDHFMIPRTGVTYRVVDVQDDSLGHVHLELVVAP